MTSTANLRQPLTILLLGTTGNGKSATGNTLLARQVFEEGAGMSFVTNATQVEQTATDCYDVTIVDTPGFFDSNGYDQNDPEYSRLQQDLTQQKKKRKDYQRRLYHSDEAANRGTGEATMTQYDNQIKRIEDEMKQKREDWRADQVQKSIIASCFSGGIHAFLVVINAHSRFSDNDREMLSFLDRKYGGSSVFNYTFVLLTYSDYIWDLWKKTGFGNRGRTIDNENQALQHFLTSGPGSKVDSFQEFLEEIDNRVLFVNNSEARKYGEKYYQRTNIFRDIDHHVKQNCAGKPFSNERFHACRDNLRGQVLDLLPHLGAPKKKLQEVTRLQDADRAREREIQQSLVPPKQPSGGRCALDVPQTIKRAGSDEGGLAKHTPEQRMLKGSISHHSSRSDLSHADQAAAGTKPRQAMTLGSPRGKTMKIRELEELQEKIKKREEDIKKLEQLSQEAEQTLDSLTIFFRDLLIQDTKWSRRGKEFRGFLKGLFLLKPKKSQRAAEEKATRKLDLQAKLAAEIMLEEEYPDLFSAYQWQKEERRKQTFLQNRKKTLRKGYEKGVKPIVEGISKVGRVFQPSDTPTHHRPARYTQLYDELPSPPQQQEMFDYPPPDPATPSASDYEVPVSRMTQQAPTFSLVHDECVEVDSCYDDIDTFYDTVEFNDSWEHL